MQTIDVSVILGYLLVVILAAGLFRRFANSSSGFVSGGGAMPWWMVGATCFMTQFSAWTFTGAAAKAFTDGFPIMMVFIGNALGFLVAGRWFAARYRLLRVDTATEIVRLRFGRRSEQLFTWLQFPLSLLSGAIWLNGLAFFFSGAFGINLMFTVITTGVLVIAIAFSGGAWSVSAINVVQLTLLLGITLVVGLYAFYLQGGPVNMIRAFPHDFWQGQQVQHPSIYLAWMLLISSQQLISTNNAMSSFRFLGTRSEQDATRAAYLAAILFLIWPLLWFSPAWFSAIQQPTLTPFYPSLGAESANAAYLFFVQHHLPPGILGLTLAAMLAATLAPMATTLNRNAGFFVYSLYLPLLRTRPSEKKLLLVGRMATLVTGVVTVLTALLFALQEQVSFFDLLMLLGAFLSLPLTIPCLLALVILRTPDWSGWATLLVGLGVSLLMHLFFDIDWLAQQLGMAELTPREHTDLSLIATIVAQVVVTGGFFCLTALGFRLPQGERLRQRAHFGARMKRPLRRRELTPLDRRVPHYLGRLTALIAILILALLPFTASGQRSLFVAIAAFCLLAAGLLRYGTQR